MTTPKTNRDFLPNSGNRLSGPGPRAASDRCGHGDAANRHTPNAGAPRYASFPRARWWYGLGVLLCLIVPATHAAQPAKLQYPVDVAQRTDGTLFIADTHLPGIWKLADNKLTVFYQATTKYRTPLNAVRCLAIDGQGRLLAGDSATREVYRFDDAGKPTPLTGGKIGTPMGIAVRKTGEIVVSDLELHCLWTISATGGAPSKLCDLPAPIGICINSKDQLLVISRIAPKVRRVSADGKSIDAVVKGTEISFPHDILVSDTGTMFVTDGYGKAIWRISDGGKPTKFVAGAPLVNPVGLTGRGQDLVIADSRAATLFKVSADGKITNLLAK